MMKERDEELLEPVERQGTSCSGREDKVFMDKCRVNVEDLFLLFPQQNKQLRMRGEGVRRSFQTEQNV